MGQEDLHRCYVIKGSIEHCINRSDFDEEESVHHEFKWSRASITCATIIKGPPLMIFINVPSGAFHLRSILIHLKVPLSQNKDNWGTKVLLQLYSVTFFFLSWVKPSENYMHPNQCAHQWSTFTWWTKIWTGTIQLSFPLSKKSIDWSWICHLHSFSQFLRYSSICFDFCPKAFDSIVSLHLRWTKMITLLLIELRFPFIFPSSLHFLPPFFTGHRWSLILICVKSAIDSSPVINHRLIKSPFRREIESKSRVKTELPDHLLAATDLTAGLADMASHTPVELWPASLPVAFECSQSQLRGRFIISL